MYTHTVITGRRNSIDKQTTGQQAGHGTHTTASFQAGGTVNPVHVHPIHVQCCRQHICGKAQRGRTGGPVAGLSHSNGSNSRGGGDRRGGKFAYFKGPGPGKPARSGEGGKPRAAVSFSLRRDSGVYWCILSRETYWNVHRRPAAY